jgi:hypothetical protein
MWHASGTTPVRSCASTAAFSRCAPWSPPCKPGDMHLGQEVTRHLLWNGPWTYALSDLYYTPEGTAAVEALQAADTSLAAISQLAA